MMFVMHTFFVVIIFFCLRWVGGGGGYDTSPFHTYLHSYLPTRLYPLLPIAFVSYPPYNVLSFLTKSPRVHHHLSLTNAQREQLGVYTDVKSGIVTKVNIDMALGEGKTAEGKNP